MKEDTTEFTIKCNMKTRWVPHFLGMLKSMQRLGGMGASRWVKLYADGDGDFHPKFEWEATLPEPASALKAEGPGQSPRDDGYSFDAG